MAQPSPHSEPIDHAPDMSGFPSAIVAKASAIMDELDDIWPLWRQRHPLSGLEFDHRARVKWLLKRLLLLSWRSGGVPAPRDWDVHVCASRHDPRESFAHPLPPGQPRNDDMWTPPPLSAEQLPDVVASASVLAFELRLPIERVEALLPYLPKGADVREWLVDAVRRAGGDR